MDAPTLGALLVRLHDGGAPDGPVQVSYRVWRHRERARGAFAAEAKRRQSRGASVSVHGRRDAEPEPPESEETVRIWRDGERTRIEHHGGERDGYYAVTDGPLWWIWDERMGGRSNQDDPSVGGNFGDELQIMLNPVPLLSSLRFVPTGTSRVAGRATITAHASPRSLDPSRGQGFELHELGSGADSYELEVDDQLGVLLSVAAIRDGQPFHRITTLAIRFEEPIPQDTFHFQPPSGETLEPMEPRLEFVTPMEAQQEAPFEVLIPDTVPGSWQVHCRLLRATRRPPSPMQIGIDYRSVDGHESVSLSESAVDPSRPCHHLADDEDWEQVTREGVRMWTRPARWGQAQVELERDGTCVHLMSDNLTRDQLLTIADGLRPAPSTSSI